MKIRIAKAAFVNGLQQVLNVVGIRSSLPILGNVLLNAKDNVLELTTTNLDMGIRCSVKADVQMEGRIALPARKLASIIKALPEADVELDCSQNQAKIISGRSKFRLMGMNDTEFPALPTFSQDKGFSLEQQTLGNMLRHVSFAQSEDENRYLLHGVFFAFRKENDKMQLHLVATDGRRLSLIQKDIEAPVALEGSEFILPAKTVIELERLLQQMAPIKIYFNDKQVAFELALENAALESGLQNSIYLVSKKVEGRFPNYQQVIPQTTVHRVKLERSLLLECIQRVSLVSSQDNNTVKLKFGDNVLELSASSAELGEAQEAMAIDYNEDLVTIAFNPRFLSDPLRSLQEDEIFFEFKDELSPGVIKTFEKFLCVVMPLRLS
ncbi:MAG: DNA polymerase III subunit beta [Puniceicoccales bacterium]|jgi:DNA polymerase-3 subunit beta|nr:DNA polymerase III subunit beta [Puniceicoccales bacterium]